MKRVFSLLACVCMLAALCAVVAPGVGAATQGYWVDRKGDELTEPYKEAKDAAYEPIPGSITSSNAFGIAGAVFSKPVGKETFKVSFDLDWVSPKRFSDANESTSIKNFFIWVNYTYTSPDDMEPWGGFDESKSPWETCSEGSFAIWNNKVGVEYPSYKDGREVTEDGNLISFSTKKAITSSVKWIEEDSGLNIAKQGKAHITVELKKNVVSLNVKIGGKDYGTAEATYTDGYFNSKTERYFGFTHFNGAFVFDITNFKVESSDIAAAVGATATSRPGAVTPAESVPDENSKDTSNGNSNSQGGSSKPDSSKPAADSSKTEDTTSDGTVSTGEPDSEVSGEEISDPSDGETSLTIGTRAPSSDPAVSDAVAEPSGGFPVWAIILIVVAILAIGGGVAFFLIRKKGSTGDDTTPPADAA